MKKISKIYALLITLIILISILVFLNHKPTKQNFDFKLTEVSDGIFVHFGKQEDSNNLNMGDIANLTMIIGSKSVLVIDTGGTPKIGERFLQKIKTITSLPISHIVITHSHPDHFFGTQAFKKLQPQIIGHERLNRSLINNFEYYKNLQFNLTGEQSLEKAELVTANTFVKINNILEIDLGNRIVEIKAWKSGHTDNDLTVIDKKTKTLITENIFVKRIPSIRASIKGWKKNLEETLNLDINLVIPGHGKMTKKEEAIFPMLSYFKRLLKETRDFHKDNKTLEDAQNQISKKNIEKWLLFENYHPLNITKTYTELEWE